MKSIRAIFIGLGCGTGLGIIMVSLVGGILMGKMLETLSTGLLLGNILFLMGFILAGVDYFCDKLWVVAGGRVRK